MTISSMGHREVHLLRYRVGCLFFCLELIPTCTTLQSTILFDGGCVFDEIELGSNLSAMPGIKWINPDRI